MQLKTILLTGVLLLPILSTADAIEPESKTKYDLTELESLGIKALIEKAKCVSSQERTKIESLIKKKIAKAHRENSLQIRG